MTDDQSRLVPRASAVGSIDPAALDRALWSLVEYVDAGKWTNATVERIRDEILALVPAVPVDATPPQGIDRTVLELWLREHLGGGQAIRAEGLADGILALARPVDGITLTPEEAATAAACVRAASRVAYMRDDLAALAARLEASS